MKNFRNKKNLSIVCGAIVLIVIILITMSCLRKEDSPEKDVDNSPQTESQEVTSDTDDVKDSTKNEDEESSKEEETLNSSKEETESPKDTFDNIFDEKSETTNDSTEDKSEVTDDNSEDNVESDSGTGDDDVTQKDETKENLEESEDTSTGYGPIS